VAVAVDKDRSLMGADVVFTDTRQTANKTVNDAITLRRNRLRDRRDTRRQSFSQRTTDNSRYPG